MFKEQKYDIYIDRLKEMLEVLDKSQNAVRKAYCLLFVYQRET